MRTHFLFTTFLALSCASFLGAEAWGQNALGDGRALDANLQQGSGGLNTRVGNTNLDFQQRNLIVTRNVVGGRGFRGSVGYTSPLEFRGATGSGDLFAFRADSALSQLAAITGSAGRTALNLGQALGSVSEVGYFRPTAGSNLQRSVEPNTFGGLYDLQSRLDQLAVSRTSMAGDLNAFGDSQLLAVRQEQDGGRYRVTADELRGVQVVAEQSDVSQLGLTLFDQASLIEDRLEGIDTLQAGMPYDDTLLDERIGIVRPEADPEAGDDEATPDAASFFVSPGYQQIMQSLGQRVAEERETLRTQRTEQVDPSEELTTESELTAFRDYLSGDSLTGELETPEDESTPPEGEGDTGEDEDAEEASDSSVQVIPESREEAAQLPVELLRHNQGITSLRPAAESRFGEIVARGEEQLRAGNYFVAERHFLRALRFQPNNPMAMAGLANAQLGAGVWVAASVSLRNMFTQHPQMIDARYEGPLLPAASRLGEVVEILRARVAQDGANMGRLGLLLAYIGHQTQDEALVREGIDLVEKANADDPLPVVLRGVWLEERGSTEMMPILPNPPQTPEK